MLNDKFQNPRKLLISLQIPDIPQNRLISTKPAFPRKDLVTLLCRSKETDTLMGMQKQWTFSEYVPREVNLWRLLNLID